MTGEKIRLRRLSPAGNITCQVCLIEDAKEWETVAFYEFTNENPNLTSEIILCPKHEHMLMEKMVNNWLKRHERKGGGNPEAKPLIKEKE